MKNFIVAAYALVALIVTPMCYADARISPIFIVQNDQMQSVPSSNLGIDSPSEEMKSGVDSGNPDVKKSASTMTSGDVLLAIGLGVLTGLVLHAATKSDYESSSPTSQGTLVLNGGGGVSGVR